MSRDVALAIGVADAKPLRFLSGALNGARQFHDWASKVGYYSHLLTDDNAAVTIPRLRTELESILDPARGPIHRMVLYFAGHGFIREAEEGLWLLSDWYREERAVAVEVLKRRLHKHNIQQIAIFADCCRSLPPDVAASDLTPDGVLGRGPIRPEKAPAIDKFIAAQDGSESFMVPGSTPDEDRCLFSGVLMEGLWGTSPEAFSKLLTDKVTSRSLGAYLQSKVPERAKYYNRALVPNVSPTFPEGDDIYFYPGSDEPPKPPFFPEWPPPSAVVLMKPRGDDESLTLGGEETTSTTSEPLIDRIRSQSRPQTFVTDSGFVVDGGNVRSIWTPPDVIAERHGVPNWWQLRHVSASILLRSAPVLIEFEDRTFAAAAALPNFIATIIREERGIAALIYRSVRPEQMGTATAAESAIAAMEKGALRVNDVADLAVRLRTGKHYDPVLGVISAYLYDSIGDIDNIRRMAFYYAQCGQPIPYEIALLAQLRGEWRRRNSLLWAHVPAVSRCDPRTEAEQTYNWTHSATEKTAGEVGGLWPWMRQGWPFLDDPNEKGTTLVIPGLTELTSHLTPGRFTTLDEEGAVELARIFSLTEREQFQ